MQMYIYYTLQKIQYLIEVNPFELAVRVRAAARRRDLTVFEELQQAVVRVNGVALRKDGDKS